MAKQTDELAFKLKAADDINKFLAENESAFDEGNFYKLLNTLITESGKRKFEIASACCISES